MRNFPTMEQLSAMPISQLKNLDIQTVDEEMMVQAAINAKVGTVPVPTPTRIKVPDIRTVEEEVFWQKKIDDEKARLAPTKIETPTVEVPVVETPSAETPKRFCELCDSKGVRHKKACPKFK